MNIFKIRPRILEGIIADEKPKFAHFEINTGLIK